MTDDEDLLKVLERLPPEPRANVLAMMDDLRRGPFGAAFWELAELVGEEEAFAYLMKGLMGGPVQ